MDLVDARLSNRSNGGARAPVDGRIGAAAGCVRCNQLMSGGRLADTCCRRAPVHGRSLADDLDVEMGYARRGLNSAKSLAHGEPLLNEALLPHKLLPPHQN